MRIPIGGGELMWSRILDYLSKIPNLHVDVLIPENEKSEFNPASGSLEKVSYSTRKKGLEETICKLISSRNYDVILTNYMSPGNLTTLMKNSNFTSKLVWILHHPVKHAFESFSAPLYGQISDVLDLGGRVYITDVGNCEDLFLDIYKRVRKNPYLKRPSEQLKFLNDERLRRFYIHKYEGHLKPSQEIDDNWIAVGRCNWDQKRLHLAVKACQELGEKLKVFTTVSSVTDRRSSKPNRLEEFLKENQSDKIQVKFNAPRKELEEELPRAKGLIFTSAFESSGGLVPFEALTAGLPVVWKHPAADHFLEKSKYSVKVEGKYTAKNFMKAMQKVNFPSYQERMAQHNFVKDFWSERKFKDRVEELVNI